LERGGFVKRSEGEFLLGVRFRRRDTGGKRKLSEEKKGKKVRKSQNNN